MVDHSSQQPLPDYLTPRELEVLQLMGKGFSNRDIAYELVISLQTARWYGKQIYSKLGAHSREQAIFRAGQLGLLDASANIDNTFRERYSPTALRHNLPLKVTPLIGRTSEVKAIIEMLNSSRFVTLTGSPGTGKTRLALQVALEVIDDYQYGVRFIELAPISDPALVAETIASALMLQETGQVSVEVVLRNYLRDKHMLLVLDNFEQVIEAASLIGEMLAAAQKLCIIVTSRQTLQIYGEHEYVVPPLSLPDLKKSQNHPIDVEDSEAVALFAQRARAAKSSFQLTDENISTVAKICVKLDGLPLAVELAAAQIKFFSPQTLLSKLEDSLNPLKSDLRDLPRRHASLNQAIDWSYNLLGDPEQTLMARLSVFVGGFSIEAAEAVCREGQDGDILDDLISLLNKGLLQQAEDRFGDPRFFMLETIHVYARERLYDRGEVNQIQRRHAEFFTQWVEYAEPYTVAGGEQLHWLYRLETDHDNLRAALAWSFNGGNHELGQRMVGALVHFWERRGHHREWGEWLARAWVGIDEVSKPVRASLLQSAGYLAFNRQANEKAIQHLKEAEQLFGELHNQHKYALMQMKRVILLSIQPEGFQEARRLIKTTVALLREIDHQPLLGHALNVLGLVEHRNGNFEEAGQVFDETLALARDIGDQIRESLMLINLGEVHSQVGNYQHADLFLRATLRLAQEIDFKYVSADTLRVFAGMALGRGQVERAAQLLGATVAAFEEIGTRPQPQDQPVFDQHVAIVQEVLDSSTFEEMWSRGRSMTLDHGLAFALADSGINGEKTQMKGVL